MKHTENPQRSVKTPRSRVSEAATRATWLKTILAHCVAAKQCRKAFQIFDQHQLLFVFARMDESIFPPKLSGTSLYYAPEDNETLSNRIKCAYWKKKNKPKQNTTRQQWTCCVRCSWRDNSKCRLTRIFHLSPATWSICPNLVNTSLPWILN